MHFPILLLTTLALLTPALAAPQPYTSTSNSITAADADAEIDIAKRAPTVGWICGRDGTDQATCDKQPPDLRAKFPHCACAVPVIGTVVGGGFTYYVCC